MVYIVLVVSISTEGTIKIDSCCPGGFHTLKEAEHQARQLSSMGETVTVVPVMMGKFTKTQLGGE